MNIESLISVKEREARAAEAERAAAIAKQESIMARAASEGRESLTPGETDEFRAASEAKREAVARAEALTAEVESLRAEAKADAEYAQRASTVRESASLPKYDEVARVGREARTYSPETAARGTSFFVDAYKFNQGDFAARERMERHANEVKVEREAKTQRATTSSFAGLVVPQYLVDKTALVLRNGRPLANLMNKEQIPSNGMSFFIPRGTTGAATAVQATENTAVQNTDPVLANVQVDVKTIAGQVDVSRQSLERGDMIDSIIYKDLVGAYAANLDSQLIVGTGTAGQVLGALNTASISSASAFGAAVTAANFTSKIAGQIQAIAGAGTQIQPRVIVMHPRRWGWLQSLTDSSGRPLAVATPVGPYNAAGLITAAGGYSADGDVAGSGVQYVGVLANGLPVVTDANIPVSGAFGGGTFPNTLSEDFVLVLDNTQHILFEDGDGMPNELRFEQTTGGSLTTKLVVYGYVAATFGRYPQAVGVVGGKDATGGNGLIAPTF